jgi:hypothetical protein
VHIRATRLLHTSPERALELAADSRQWSRLFDSIIELRPLTRGPLNLGSRVLVVRKIGPFKTRQVLEVSGISDTGIIMHTEGPGPGRLVLSLVAVAEANGVRVTVDLGGRIAGPGALITPLFQRALQREWETFLDRLGEAETVLAI